MMMFQIELVSSSSDDDDDDDDDDVAPELEHCMELKGGQEYDRCSEI